MSDNQEAIDRLNRNLEQVANQGIVKMYNSMPRLLWVHFLKGVALGLGSLIGAGMVLSLFMYMLAQIEFIPIIGEWASEIMQVVKDHQS